MSKFWKVVTGITVAAGAVAVCVCCPGVSAAIGKAAMLAAPSVCEIIDNEGYWPLV